MSWRDTREGTEVKEACLHPNRGSRTLFCEGLGKEGVFTSFGIPWCQAQAESPWLPGVQRQSLYCMEMQAGLVDEEHCEHLDRPDDRQRKCSEEPCPPRQAYCPPPDFQFLGVLLFPLHRDPGTSGEEDK